MIFDILWLKKNNIFTYKHKEYLMYEIDIIDVHNLLILLINILCVMMTKNDFLDVLP